VDDLLGQPIGGMAPDHPGSASPQGRSSPAIYSLNVQEHQVSPKLDAAMIVSMSTSIKQNCAVCSVCFDKN